MAAERKAEVLAPAGSYESMKAAVNAGADAVYMGGKRFSARAYAENPGDEELISAIDYVHIHGRKIYIAVNTLIKDDELHELHDFLLPLYEAGADAVLVQDTGALRKIREWFPDLPIHASTQLTVTGVAGAKFAKDMGASRIVTARELSTEEIKRIRDEVDIEIESFVHGALCYCYSGQCLLSSMTGGRSANRGRCAGPCRLPYSVSDGGRPVRLPHGDYVLSLKDLCGLDSLGELIDAGVCSLKIEGRMKSPLYTAGVVSIYRKYVDLYCEAKCKDLRIADDDRDLLLDLFDRGGMSDGYFHTENGRQMMAFAEKPDLRRVDQKKRSGIKEMYLESDIKEKVSGALTVSCFRPAELSMKCRDTCITAYGDPAQKAENHPLGREEAEGRIRKLGGTPFEYGSLDVNIEDDCFLPVSSLNELRRSAVSELTKAIISKYRRSVRGPVSGSEDAVTYPAEKAAKAAHPRLAAFAENESQVQEILRHRSVDRIYLSLNCISWDKISDVAFACRRRKCELFLALPEIYRIRAEKELKEHSDKWLINGISGFLVRNPDEVMFIEKLGKKYSYVADHSFYAFNREAKAAVRDLGFSMDTAPLELNARELSRRGLSGSEMIVYGRLPLMISAQCLRKNTERCCAGEGALTLRDRKNMQFPVKNYCRFCYNVIYNSVPLWLADDMEEIRLMGPAMLRLVFTTEDNDEISAVINACENAIAGQDAGWRPGKYTRGHFRRGVE